MTGDMEGFVSEIIEWHWRVPEGSRWRPVRMPIVRVQHPESGAVVTVGSTECELLNRSHGIAIISKWLRARGWMAAS